MTMLRSSMLLLIALLAVSQAHGSEPGPKSSLALASESFLAHHPDIRWRNEGMALYDEGKYESAFKLLMRSASFAEKSSQAMIAEMHWTGTGTEKNLPLAYAWMDLAAERNYNEFVVLREHYWSKLDEAQRAEALRVGKGVYASFGDDVAKTRLARKLERGRRTMTGSRTGFVGPLQIAVRVDGGFLNIGGDEFYADEFWKPSHYFEWKDRVWKETRKGYVEVGAVSTQDAKRDLQPARE